jgi:hypothetical protein
VSLGTAATPYLGWRPKAEGRVIGAKHDQVLIAVLLDVFQDTRIKVVSRQSSLLVVVQIEDLPLTFAILRNRDADAGAALTIDKIDSLRHRIGIFAAMVHGFEA